MPSTQLQQRLRLNRAFQMQMQLALWQPAEPIDYIDLRVLFPLLPSHLVSVIAAIVSGSCNAVASDKPTSRYRSEVSSMGRMVINAKGGAEIYLWEKGK